MNQEKKNFVKKNKFLILNLVILLLLFVLFLLIGVNAYIQINDNNLSAGARLVPGNEYRFTSAPAYRNVDLRIFYSSGATNDIFMPIKTQAEWSAFYSYHPSTVEITTLSCSMVGTTNWNPTGIYGCSGTNKRCYGGVCRTCSGYIYSDGCSGCAGQGGNACWRDSNGEYSCNSACGSYGGCIQANWDDSSSCTVCNYFRNPNQGHCGDAETNCAPFLWENTWGNTYCSPRSASNNQDCGCVPTGVGSRTRFCVCAY
jgi:hypothetical protein